MLMKYVSKMEFDASHDFRVADAFPLSALSVGMKCIKGIVVPIRK
jgi:hypothetical protein